MFIYLLYLIHMKQNNYAIKKKSEPKIKEIQTHYYQ